MNMNAQQADSDDHHESSPQDAAVSDEAAHHDAIAEETAHRDAPDEDGRNDGERNDGTHPEDGSDHPAGADEHDSAPQDEAAAYQRLRDDYDALIAAIDRLQNHQGLFLLRQMTGTVRPAGQPRPLLVMTKMAQQRAQDAATGAELTMENGRLSGGAARYYAAELLALLRDLQQRAGWLAAQASTSPAGTERRAAQGPGVAQMLSESQRLLLKAESDIQPLIARVLTACDKQPASDQR